MENKKANKFTRFVSIGWWISFAIFVAHAIVIDIAGLTSIPFFGLGLLGIFVILSCTAKYDKNYKFSPYKGIFSIVKSKSKRKN